MNYKILILFLLLGCSNQLYIKKIKNDDEKRLFPDGRYCHDIKIKLKDRPEVSMFGINEITSEKVVVVGVSNIGNTLLSYSKNLSCNEETIYFDKNFIKTSESNVKDLVQLLLQIYQIDSRECENDKCIKSWFGVELLILLENKIPKTIKISRGEKIEVDIKMVECINE